MARNKAQEASVSERIVRGLTLRRIIGVIIVVVCLKASLDFLRSFYSNEPFELIIEDQKNFQFRPTSCMYINGTCQPILNNMFDVQSKGLYAENSQFYMDGRPFRILSGSFHYFRTMPSLWGDRLLRMQASGLNTVMTYIPWNLHEKKRGEFNFGGLWDLAGFIQQVQKVGLYLIIRPGPYICAEWEYGGLPSWLMSEPDIKVRSSSSRIYMKYVENYFTRLLPLLSKFSYKNGGPIIAFQVENEFGSYSKDPDYLRFLLQIFKNNGIQELLFTSDGTKQLPNGTISGVLATVNFYKHAAEKLGALKAFQPDKPLMVTEYWSGWFDHWGENHHAYGKEELEESLGTILKMNASINFYMFVGGTNFEFWNGANFITNSSSKTSNLAPTITSYDYDAPISECGDIKPKFEVIRKLIIKYSSYPLDLPPIPPNPAKAAYGKKVLKQVLPYEELVRLVPEKDLFYEAPRYMEYLPINNKGGQGYGWILYRTTFPKTTRLDFIGKLVDRAQIFVNGEQLVILSYWDASEDKVNITLDISKLSNSNKLDILVENLGRINYKHFLDDQRKGFQGKILTADGDTLKNFLHVPFEFCIPFRNYVKNAKWTVLEGEYIHHLPAAYRASFNIEDNPADTFLDMSNWEKGVVIVNGFHIGRYWEKGPQQTLYVPSTILNKGPNLFTIYEMGTVVKEFSVEFTDAPKLG